MAASVAALLDELMGSERDVPLDERTNKTRRFNDPDVCKHYLCGFDVHCFRNTRSADELARHLPPADFTRVQDDACRAEWEALTDEEKTAYGYERDLKRLLDRLVADCDARIQRAVERVAQEQPSASSLTPEQRSVIDTYVQQIAEQARRAEALGEAGDVDGAQDAVAKVEALTAGKEAMEKRLAPEKTMSVCPVSGVFMSSTDNEQRRAEHLNGKQYVGWKRVRELRDAVTARLEAYERAGIGTPSGPRASHRRGGGHLGHQPGRRGAGDASSRDPSGAPPAAAIDTKRRDEWNQRRARDGGEKSAHEASGERRRDRDGDRDRDGHRDRSRDARGGARRRDGRSRRRRSFSGGGGRSRSRSLSRSGRRDERRDRRRRRSRSCSRSTSRSRSCSRERRRFGRQDRDRDSDRDRGGYDPRDSRPPPPPSHRRGSRR